MLFDFLPDWNCLLNVVTQTPSNQGWEKCPLLEALEGFDKFAKNPSNPPLQPFNYKTSRFCRRPCTSLSPASIKEGFKKMKFFIINLFWSEREAKMALKSQPFPYIYSVICIQHTYRVNQIRHEDLWQCRPSSTPPLPRAACQDWPEPARGVDVLRPA